MGIVPLMLRNANSPIPDELISVSHSNNFKHYNYAIIHWSLIWRDSGIVRCSRGRTWRSGANHPTDYFIVRAGDGVAVPSFSLSSIFYKR